MHNTKWFIHSYSSVLLINLTPLETQATEQLLYFVINGGRYKSPEYATIYGGGNGDYDDDDDSDDFGDGYALEYYKDDDDDDDDDSNNDDSQRESGIDAGTTLHSEHGGQGLRAAPDDHGDNSDVCDGEHIENNDDD